VPSIIIPEGRNQINVATQSNGPIHIKTVFLWNVVDGYSHFPKDGHDNLESDLKYIHGLNNSAFQWDYPSISIIAANI
jgi:hypothetical protein